MNDGSDPRIVVGVSALLLVALGALIVETLGLPAGVYDPLGSASVPRATAAIAAVIVLWMGGFATRALLRGRSGDQVALVEGSSSRRGAAVALMTPLYVLSMQFGVLNFSLATVLFLFAAIMTMRNLERRAILPAAIIATIAGFGGQWIFTKVFYVDLPARVFWQ